MGQYFDRHSWTDAAAAIQGNGCCVVKAALSADLLGGLHEKATAFFEMARAGTDDEVFSELLHLPVSHISGHIAGARTRGVVHYSILSQYIYGDTLTLGHDLAKQLAQPEIVSMIESAIGPDVFLHTNNLAVRFRKQSDAGVNLPFHQDSFYWNEPEIFSGSKPVMLVLWTPFTAVGPDVPGLELVERPLTAEYQITPTPQSQFGHLEIGDDKVLEEYADQLWYPSMQTGDVCVFGERVLHRSYGSPLTDAPRTSIDLRVLSMGRVPKALKGHVGIRLPSLEEVVLS